MVINHTNWTKMHFILCLMSLCWFHFFLSFCVCFVWAIWTCLMIPIWTVFYNVDSGWNFFLTGTLASQTFLERPLYNTGTWWLHVKGFYLLFYSIAFQTLSLSPTSLLILKQGLKVFLGLGYITKTAMENYITFECSENRGQSRLKNVIQPKTSFKIWILRLSVCYDFIDNVYIMNQVLLNIHRLSPYKRLSLLKPSHIFDSEHLIQQNFTMKFTV